MRTRNRLLDRLMRLSRRQLLVGVLTLVLCAGAAGWLARPERHAIFVSGLEEPISFVTTQQKLGDALREQGIEIGERDSVTPDLSTSLKGQKEITISIKRAVAITIVDGGQQLRVESTADSVEGLLEELHLSVGEMDSLSLPLQAKLETGMLLTITRRHDEVVTVYEEIPFETVTRDDSALRLGSTEIRQTGEPGRKAIQRRVVFEDGQEVASETLAEMVVQEPVPQIVAYGTLGVVSRGGQEFRYTQELQMVATGYTAGPESNPHGTGITYTGMRAEPGVVAVDPQVIPLYTRLYIEGYGPAVAGDIGGAIKGNRIDLCFETVEEALRWGVRTVTVYVVSD